MLLAPLLLTALQLQTTPILKGTCSHDLITPVATEEVHYRFAGEVREVERVVAADGSIHAWIAEDGGRIRHTNDNGQTWQFQETPWDARQTLLDIHFTDTMNGFACGRAGVLLYTNDGGAHWDHFPHSHPRIHDDFGHFATNWAVRWVDQQLGFVAGVWSLARKSPTTAAFEQVNLWDSEAQVVPQAGVGDYLPRQFEFYDVKIIRDTTTPGRWVGVAIGDRNAPDPGNNPPAGFFFYTDSASPKSDNGRNWWKVHQTPTTTGNDFLLNPWEVEFEAEDGDPDSTAGYLVGGNTSARGYIFYTPDGGQSWTEEFAEPVNILNPGDQPPFPAELYAVAAMPNGEAMAVGYAGNVWRRNPNASSAHRWQWRPVRVVPDGNYTVFDRLRFPITCIDASGGAGVTLGGSFGTLRATVDSGQSYTHWNPMHDAANPEPVWRFHDVHYWNGQEGIGVGQFQLIAQTLDGGTTWQRVSGGPCNPISSCSSTALASVAFLNRNHGVVASAGDDQGTLPLLQWTSDGGLSWNPSMVPTLQQAKITEVVAARGRTFWAIGSEASHGSARSPLVLMSRTRGATWAKVPAPTSLSPVELTGAAFLAPLRGFLIGNESGIPRAWRLEVTSGVFTWHSVSPSMPVIPESPLRDIAVRGTSYSTAEVYAVGAIGTAYKYDSTVGTLGKFVEFTPITQNAQLVPPLGSPLEVNLVSVGISPSGNRVLFGTEPWSGPLPASGQDTSFSLLAMDANQLGFLLRWDEATQTLDQIKVGHNEATRKLQMVSESCGVVLARTHTGGLVSGEIGTVSDFTVLIYDED
jgi:photosystem II stability/assembly factor-like uncharacterized protein